MVSLAKPTDGVLVRNWKRLLIWAGLSVVIFFILYLIVGRIQRGQWDVELTQDPITDAASGSAVLLANDTDGWGGYWELRYYCRDGKTRLSMSSTHKEEVDFLFRFDNNKPIPVTFDYTPGGARTSAPGDEPVQVEGVAIAQLRKSKRLVVRTVRGAPRPDIFFNTHGADIATRKIDEQCRG